MLKVTVLLTVLLLGTDESEVLRFGSYGDCAAAEDLINRVSETHRATCSLRVEERPVMIEEEEEEG